MVSLNKLLNADYSARFFTLLHDIKRNVIHVVCTNYYRVIAFMMGVDLGRNVSFNGHIIIDRFKYSKIVIGDGCIFNSHSAFNRRGIKKCILHTRTDFAEIIIGKGSGMSGVSIIATQMVSIGDNVNIGANTQIADTDGHNEILHSEDKPIRIEDNVFIGMNCMILKGVTIGKNAIIGAGSVVTKDIPQNAVAAGVPCKVIRIKE